MNRNRSALRLYKRRKILTWISHLNGFDMIFSVSACPRQIKFISPHLIDHNYASSSQ